MTPAPAARNHCGSGFCHGSSLAQPHDRATADLPNSDPFLRKGMARQSQWPAGAGQPPRAPRSLAIPREAGENAGGVADGSRALSESASDTPGRCYEAGTPPGGVPEAETPQLLLHPLRSAFRFRRWTGGLRCVSTSGYLLGRLRRQPLRKPWRRGITEVHPRCRCQRLTSAATRRRERKPRPGTPRLRREAGPRPRAPTRPQTTPSPCTPPTRDGTARDAATRSAPPGQ